MPAVVDSIPAANEDRGRQVEAERGDPGAIHDRDQLQSEALEPASAEGGGSAFQGALRGVRRQDGQFAGGLEAAVAVEAAARSQAGHGRTAAEAAGIQCAASTDADQNGRHEPDGAQLAAQGRCRAHPEPQAAQSEEKTEGHRGNQEGHPERNRQCQPEDCRRAVRTTLHPHEAATRRR